jgi:hypothetical protein
MAKDHFVPRFYLRNFQIPAEPGRIFQYQRKKNPEAVEIKGIAQEEDYYDLKADAPQVKKDLVDRLLGKAEKSSAGVLQKLLEAANIKLTSNERGYLAWFIALLAARTPFQRNRFASLDIALREVGIKEMLKDPKNIEDILREHPEVSRKN